MSLKYAVLGLLKEKPMYGYEIKQKFEKSFGQLWPISYGQLYPTLKSLSEADFVTLKTEKGKKSHEKNVYKITDSGLQCFEEWMKSEDKKSSYSIKDDFTLSLFFANENNKSIVLQQADIHLIKIGNEINNFKDKLNSKSNHSIYQKMVIEKMIDYLEMEKNWLIKLIENIK